MLKRLLLVWVRLSSRSTYPGVILLFLPGTSSLLLFWYFTSLVPEAIFLLFGVRFISGGLVELLGASVLTISAENRHKLATASSASAAFLFLIWRVESAILAGLFWVVVFLNIKVGVLALFRTLVDNLVLPGLMFCYKKGWPAATKVPLVYIISAPGLNPYYGQRFARDIMLALDKLNLGLAPVLSDSVRRKPADFRRWIAAQSAALVVVRRPPQVSGDGFERTQLEYGALCPGSIFTLYIEPEKLKGKFVGEYVEFEELNATFAGEQDLFEELRTGSAEDSAKTYDGLSGSAAKFVARFTSTILPTTESDAKLPDALRQLLPLFSREGLPPIANCYLRFRLARSDVERYLCLLDCVEVLVKFSALILLANSWARGETPREDVLSKLARPSLGHWIEVMRQLINRPEAGDLERSLAKFWEQPLLNAPKQLIDEARGAGLAWRGRVPRSHLGWLEWFVWLRNATRGHGSIEEEIASTLWHDFHETFLQLVADLQEVTVFSALVTRRRGGDPRRHRGWQRAGIQSARQQLEPDGVCFFAPSDYFSADPLLLYPLVIQKSGRFLLWNSVRGKDVEYIDYGTGQLEQVTLHQTNPHGLWKYAAPFFSSS